MMPAVYIAVSGSQAVHLPGRPRWATAATGVVVLAGVTLWFYLGSRMELWPSVESSSPWAYPLASTMCVLGSSTYAIMSVGWLAMIMHARAYRLGWCLLWAGAVSLIMAAGLYVGYAGRHAPSSVFSLMHIVGGLVGVFVVAAAPTASRHGMRPSLIVTSTVMGVVAVIVVVVGHWWFVPAAAFHAPALYTHSEIGQSPSGQPRQEAVVCAVLRSIQDREQMHDVANSVRYTELQAGRGPYPRNEDTAVVHYRSWRANDIEVANTYKRGRPERWDATSPLFSIVRWMRPGAKWRVAAVANLSQEELEGRGITDTVFVYEIELLGVERTSHPAP